MLIYISVLLFENKIYKGGDRSKELETKSNF